MKKGSYINTYSNRKFWPLDPSWQDIHLIDIAHALSMLCRANGHCKHFYSVGQHSINCAFEAKNRGLSSKIQFACLLHDASEAYISDITRPVKKMLSEYLIIEEKLQQMIYEKFGISNLSFEEKRVIKEIDDAMLNYEMEVLLNNHGLNKLELSTNYDLSFKLMEEVKNEFISLTEELKESLL